MQPINTSWRQAQFVPLMYYAWGVTEPSICFSKNFNTTVFEKQNFPQNPQTSQDSPQHLDELCMFAGWYEMSLTCFLKLFVHPKMLKQNFNILQSVIFYQEQEYTKEEGAYVIFGNLD